MYSNLCCLYFACSGNGTAPPGAATAAAGAAAKAWAAAAWVPAAAYAAAAATPPTAAAAAATAAGKKNWSPDTFWSRILSKSSASAGELSSYEWPPSARHGDQQSQHEPSHWQVLTHSLVWSLHQNPILSESLLCLRCLSGHIVTGQATGTNAFYHHTTSIRQGFPLT